MVLATPLASPNPATEHTGFYTEPDIHVLTSNNAAAPPLGVLAAAVSGRLGAVVSLTEVAAAVSPLLSPRNGAVGFSARYLCHD